MVVCGRETWFCTSTFGVHIKVIMHSVGPRVRLSLFYRHSGWVVACSKVLVEHDGGRGGRVEVDHALVGVW